MFKVYKWFEYYLLRPHKKFEHLLKYLAIYFAKLNKLQKNRKERLNREIRKTYLSPGARPTSPAGPAREASSVVFLPARQSSSLERPSTPWTPPRRPGASRPPQDVKVRHGDALDSLSHFPPSPLRPEPSSSFPLLPREQPPLIVVRSRGQHQEEGQQSCPLCAASSSSSPCCGSGARTTPSHRIRHRRL